MGTFHHHHLIPDAWLELGQGLQVGRFSSRTMDAFELKQHQRHLIYVHTGIAELSDMTEDFAAKLVSNQLIKVVPTTSIYSEDYSEDIDLIVLSIPGEVKGDEELSLADLNEPDNVNGWVAGYGDQVLSFKDFSLAHVVFNSKNQFEEVLQPGEVYHKHHQGHEYYLVVQGKSTIRIETNNVEMMTMDLLEVLPGTCHKWINSVFPVKGLNFRFPSVDGDKEICS